MRMLDICSKYVFAGLAATLASLGTAHAGVTVLHAFAGGNDGINPQAGLIADKAGNLYGTTVEGGNGLDVRRIGECSLVEPVVVRASALGERDAGNTVGTQRAGASASYVEDGSFIAGREGISAVKLEGAGDGEAVEGG